MGAPLPLAPSLESAVSPVLATPVTADHHRCGSRHVQRKADSAIIWTRLCNPTTHHCLHTAVVGNPCLSAVCCATPFLSLFVESTARVSFCPPAQT
eukprot:3490909-Amphidinium_carterae.1